MKYILLFFAMINLLSLCKKDNIEDEVLQVDEFITVFKSDQDTVHGGAFYKINWFSNLRTPLALTLCNRDEMLWVISKGIYNTGKYYWFIPDSVDTNDQYSVKLSSVYNDSVFAYSDYFMIVQDPTVKYEMIKEDYQMLVDYIADHGTYHDYINSYGDEEYYYGASAYYLFFDMRVTKRRDIDPLGLLNGLTDEQALDEIFNRLPEALEMVLEQRFPDAEPEYFGLDVYYYIEYNTFEDGYVDRRFEAQFKCVDSGKFEYIGTTEIVYSN